MHISVLVCAHSFSHESTEFYTVDVAPGDTNAAAWMSNLNSWTSNKNTSPCRRVEIFQNSHYAGFIVFIWIHFIQQIQITLMFLLQLKATQKGDSLPVPHPHPHPRT